jgi:hypothetical protein
LLMRMNMAQRQRYIEFGSSTWTFTSQGEFTGKLDRRDLYAIGHRWTPSVAGGFGQIETDVKIPKSWKAPFAVHFYASDDYASEPNPQSPHDWWGIESYVGHRFKQVLVNGVAVWEQDVGDHVVCPAFCVDITPHVTPGKPFRLTLRVLDKVASSEILPDDFSRIGTVEGNKTPDGPRNFSTNVWWGDIAIREQDDAMSPMPPRQMPAQAKVKSLPLNSFPLPPLDEPWKRPIVLPVDTESLPEAGFPITCGIPLPYGKVKDAAKLGLRNAKGIATPAQFKAMNKWPDGSLRWALADVIAKPGAGPYTLTFDATAAKPPKAVRVTSRDGGARIDTGVMSLGFGAKDYTLLDSMTVAGRAVGGVSAQMTAGATHGDEELKAVRDSFKVTARGPVRAEVEVAGKLIGKNRSIGRFVFRVAAYAGLPLLRTFFRVFNDTDETVKIKEITLNIPAGLASNARVRWTDAGGTCEANAKRDFEISQPEAGAWKVKGIVGKVRPGENASGWFEFADSNTTVQIGVRRFWQQCPKAMRVRDGAAEIGLCGKPGFEQTSGEAKRHEVWINFGESDQAMAACMLNPPRLFSPDYVAATGALGPCHARIQGDFGDYSEFVRMAYDNKPPDELGIGIRHFGDRLFGRTGTTWCNNYYDHIRECLAEYRMSGGRMWYDRAEDCARHLMDIDQCHYSADPNKIGGIPSYDAIDHTGGGVWDNLLRHGGAFCEYYRLTGDPDAKQAMIDLAGFILRNKRMTRPGGSKRDYAGVMLTCIFAYDETGDIRYLKHCRKIVEAVLDQKPRDRAATFTDIRRGTFVEIHGNFNYYGNVPWMLGQLSEPMYAYWRLTGDPDAARAIVGFAESVVCEDMESDAPGDFFGYSHNPMAGKSNKYQLLIGPLMAYAYDITGDDYFLTCARGAYEHAMRYQRMKYQPLLFWNAPTLLHFLSKWEGRKV